MLKYFLLKLSTIFIQTTYSKKIDGLTCDYHCHQTCVCNAAADGLDFGVGASCVELLSRLAFCVCGLFLDDNSSLPYDFC